jgi:hypothetical protein
MTLKFNQTIKLKSKIYRKININVQLQKSKQIKVETTGNQINKKLRSIKINQDNSHSYLDCTPEHLDLPINEYIYVYM